MYLHCHECEVACGAVVLLVTVVRMLSSDIYMKAWEWSKNAKRWTYAPFALQMKRERTYKYTSQEAKIMVHDGSK